MRGDVLAWAAGGPMEKLVSKETLNHPGLIELVSGMDVYQHTPEAYRRAYAALGIDLVNRVPLVNAPSPTPPGQTRPHPDRPYHTASLGVYDTVMRHSYPCASPDEVWALDVEALVYEDLLTPVPHSCAPADIRLRDVALGDAGLYYPMLYTTLFMWGVEVLGWETFMAAAALDPDRFHAHFLLPCVRKAQALVDALATLPGMPFVFVHDDLATATGPVFRPAWYDRYILPHYPEIFAGARQRGKKIILVADGNMTAFLPRLVQSGVDGLMFESPATPLEAVMEHFGAPGRYFIGGIETPVLTFGTPADIQRMVERLVQRVSHAGCQASFAMASGGGLHGGIPLANLAAYFDARADVGATPAGWRTHSRKESG